MASTRLKPELSPTFCQSFARALPVQSDPTYGEFTQYPLFVLFFTFLHLLENLCAFSSAVLKFQIRTK